MKLNDHPELLKVGDRVTTDYAGPGVSLRGRRLTVFEIVPDAGTASGKTITAGDGRSKSVAVRGVDASWFLPARGREAESAKGDAG